MENERHYRIKRHEFGHHQDMTLNRMDAYGYSATRGYANPDNTGRNYEHNEGYRQQYDRMLDRYPEGPHRGKGPRSYQRSDERIREDISDRMCDNAYLGIGLFLVKESVKMLRGKISVKSQLNEWTVFYLTIPNFKQGNLNVPESDAIVDTEFLHAEAMAV